MKINLFASAMILLFTNVSMADVTEVSNVKVGFQKFGTFTQTTTTSYKNLLKSESSQGNFESAGLMGKLASNFFAKGKTGNIANLPEKNLYSINYDNSTYTVSKIEKINIEQGKSVKEEKAEKEDTEESRYKIIRNELKVVDTGNKKTVNIFETKEYQIIYILETEDLASKAVQTDSMFVTVLACSDKAIFEKASKEKAAFDAEYFKLLGLDEVKQDFDKMIGMNWIKVMGSIDVKSQGRKSDIDYSEMKKINGYPVVTDGRFFTRTIDPNAPAESAETVEEDSGPAIPTSIGGLLSKAKNKAKTKMVKDKPKPKAGDFNEVLSFYSETSDIKFDAVPETGFKVPAGFKEKK